MGTLPKHKPGTGRLAFLMGRMDVHSLCEREATSDWSTEHRERECALGSLRKEGLAGSSQAGLSDGRPIRERAFGKGMLQEFVVKYSL